MSVEWDQYAKAYKAIHNKIAEVLAKLDNQSDPALFAILSSTVADLKRITRIEFPAEFPVSNLGQIINGDFEIAITAGLTTHIIPGWLIPGPATKSYSGDRFTGYKCLSLLDMGGATYFKGAWQFFSPPIATKYIKSFSLMYTNWDWDPWDLKVQLYYSDGTNTIQTQNMPGWAPWTKLGLTYSEEKFITAIHIWTTCTVEYSIFIDTVSLNYEQAIQIRGEATPVTAVINQTGDNTIATPASGKRLYVKKIQVSNRSSTLKPRISFKFGASGTEHFPLTLAEEAVETIDFVGMNWKGGVDESFIAVRDSVTATVDCTVMKEEAEL